MRPPPDRRGRTAAAASHPRLPSLRGAEFEPARRLATHWRAPAPHRHGARWPAAAPRPRRRHARFRLLPARARPGILRWRDLTGFGRRARRGGGFDLRFARSWPSRKYCRRRPHGFHRLWLKFHSRVGGLRDFDRRRGRFPQRFGLRLARGGSRRCGFRAGQRQHRLAGRRRTGHGGRGQLLRPWRGTRRKRLRYWLGGRGCRLRPRLRLRRRGHVWSRHGSGLRIGRRSGRRWRRLPAWSGWRVRNSARGSWSGARSHAGRRGRKPVWASSCAGVKPWPAWPCRALAHRAKRRSDG